MDFEVYKRKLGIIEPDRIFIFYRGRSEVGNYLTFSATIFLNTESGQECRRIQCDTKKGLIKKLKKIVDKDIECYVIDSRDVTPLFISELEENMYG